MIEDTDSPKRLFLLEGKTDEIIVRSVLDILIIQNVQFDACIGIENLLKDLPALIKKSDMRSIGIVVDANNSLEQRRESIRDKLIRSDLEIELPKTSCHCGTVQEFGDQVISIWVVPDNQKSSVLENFLRN